MRRPLSLLAAALLAACGEDQPDLLLAPPSGQHVEAILPAPLDGVWIKTSGSPGALVWRGQAFVAPNRETLEACTGGRPSITLPLAAYPTLPQRLLPDARVHSWMRGDRPVIGSGQLVLRLAGCVKEGIRSPWDLAVIFGRPWYDFSHVLPVPPEVLAQLPSGDPASPFPHRRAGMAIRGDGQLVKVILSSRSASGVPSPERLAAHGIGMDQVLRIGEAEFREYVQRTVLHEPSTNGITPGPRGDDYPLKNTPRVFDPNGCVNDHFGFCSRNCTSFAAHRLRGVNGVAGFHNRWGIATGKWGHASNWPVAARRAGLRVDREAEVGAVAVWGSSRGRPYGHVAWVAAVNGDRLVIEDYNANNRGTYRTTTISTSSVTSFIHF